MSTVRVVVAATPRMVREMVIAILAGAPGIEIMREFSESEAKRFLGSTANGAPAGADVMIVTDGWVSAADQDRLLSRGCRLKLLALTPAGDQASLVEMRAVRLSLGDVTSESLIGMVQACAQGRQASDAG